MLLPVVGSTGIGTSAWTSSTEHRATASSRISHISIVMGGEDRRRTRMDEAEADELGDTA